MNQNDLVFQIKFDKIEQLYKATCDKYPNYTNYSTSKLKALEGLIKQLNKIEKLDLTF